MIILYISQKSHEDSRAVCLPKRKEEKRQIPKFSFVTLKSLKPRSLFDDTHSCEQLAARTIRRQHIKMSKLCSLFWKREEIGNYMSIQKVAAELELRKLRFLCVCTETTGPGKTGEQRKGEA